MRDISRYGSLLALGLILLFMVAGAAAYEAMHVGRIYPGVHAGEVDLSNLGQRDAASKLAAVSSDLLSQRLMLQYAGQSWVTTFADLGLRYDVAPTVADAYAVGRQSGSVARLGTQFLPVLVGASVAPRYSVDAAKLDAFVQELSRSIDRPVRDAGVKLIGTQLQVTAAQDGRVLDPADTIAQVRARMAALSTEPVTLKVTTTRPVTADEDVGAAVDQARRWVGSDLRLETPSGSATLTRDQIAALIRLGQNGGKGPVMATLDTAALSTLLQPLAAAAVQPAHDATFAIKDGALVVSQPGQDGRQLNADMAAHAVVQAIEAGQGVVALPVSVIHPDLYGLEDAAAAQQRVAQLAGKPVTLQAAAKTWQLAPSDLSALVQLNVTKQDEHEQLTVAVRTDAIQSLIQQIAGEIDQDPANARFAWNGGALKLTAPSQDGRQLDQAAAVSALVQAMQTDQRTVPLPVKVTKPAVSGDHPEQLGIKELVAAGTSNFAGSPPERITNIARGAQLIDGAIIAPGQVFSFDDTVGEISTATGFVTGLVIMDHETKDGIGGGICQVSTTVFRAAFWAGLPILERHDHAYAVPYYTQGGYPEGFDATIYSPQLDLKFKNDTPGYLLLQTSVNRANNTMQVSLYGTKTGRQVQLVDGPETNRVTHPPDLRKPDPSLPKGVIQQVDWAHDGFDTWVERVITVNGSVTAKDVFQSHSQAWQAVYLVGTGPSAAKKG